MLKAMNLQFSFLRLKVHRAHLDICRRENSSGMDYVIEKPYKLYKLEMGPDLTVKITKEDALKYMEQMVTIRRLENELATLYKNREARGFCHLYAGQEACGVGIKAVMGKHDALITSYRAHGWAYLLGVSTYQVIAELLGRSTGCSRGKGGSMHTYAPNFFGGNGIVGAQVPLGVGAAFALKYTKSGGIFFTLYGDGAANQGQVHESYNLSKLLNIPVVFICENNKFAMGTADFRGTASIEFYSRGHYLPGFWVDGMDVLAVREAMRFAKAHILADKGPIVLELETYRYYGHSMSDPGTSYRTRDDIQDVRKHRDPITKFREKITSLKLVTENELKKIDDDVKHQIDEDVKKARADGYPKMEELAGDVYVNPLQKHLRGISPFTPLVPKHFGKLLHPMDEKIMK